MACFPLEELLIKEGYMSEICSWTDIRQYVEYMYNVRQTSHDEGRDINEIQNFRPGELEDITKFLNLNTKKG